MTDDSRIPAQPKRPAPRMVVGRSGTRLYSMNALRERIEDQFHEEYDSDSPALHEADTPTKLLKLILAVADYVLAVESIQLAPEDKADLIRRLHSNLFGFGALDPLLADERITTISLAGADHIAVRYGHGELTTLDAVFEDTFELQRVVERLLTAAQIAWSDDLPIIETGIIVAGRPASLTLAAPPVSPFINIDLRLHPRRAPTLDDLVAAEVMTPDVADLLRAIVASPYGLMVVGDSECGKTTLLSALASLLPDHPACIAVERTGELRLPEAVQRLRVRYPSADDLGATFGEQIGAALVTNASCLLLDEVRGDEPYTIAPLLERPDAPRQFWSVRGVPDSKRLQSALGMLARRAAPGAGEAPVHALYERLPFIVTLARIRERLQVFSVAEWQSRADSDYPDYVMLRRYQDGAARPTERTPARWIG